MKGVVFNAFFAHVEDQFGLETLDQLVSDCDLKTGGAYTAVGTYEFSELVAMLVRLSEISGQSIPSLTHHLGRFLFGYLAEVYPDATQHASNAFELVMSIEQQIHKEVRKLYPDAELPQFEHTVSGPEEITLIYRSTRNLGDLANGLLEGCFAHYGENIDIDRSELEDGATRFRLRKVIDRNE